ncbi:MAG: cyclodeaminase/cyclohydrolase family protein, partial [Chloroflexi bacterium]|nr:cyclodeaminase/cyclohydrolase family protein [Chloroflexota bacterium]
LPRDTEENVKIRENAIMEASFTAASVPLHTVEMCLQVMKLAFRMAQIGNLSAISDAASGLYQAKAGLEAAYLNVEINLLGYENENKAIELLQRAKQLRTEAAEITIQLQTLLKDRAEL